MFFCLIPVMGSLVCGKSYLCFTPCSVTAGNVLEEYSLKTI